MNIFYKIFGIKTKEQKLKQRKFEVLEDTIKYYSEDSEARRCSSTSSQCYYSPEKANKPESDGCAIGRLLEPELRIELDKLPPSSINEKIFSQLPDNIKILGVRFLSRLQKLHDESGNWNKNGLTFVGGMRANDIKMDIAKGNI